MSLSAASYVGTRLDRRYRLDRLVGEGASAWVFAAHDVRLEREVAIKLLKAGDESRRGEEKQFVEEGRTLAKLVHPHIVLVHDAAETDDGLCYLVMELSAGGTLETELTRRKILPVEEALRLLVPLLGALACAHDREIIHRDIKPANIALQREHGEVRAKLLDFGIAQRRDRTAPSAVAVGTPSHMAPEQARGDPLTAAVDVWAMGVVFFRCLTGSMPFESSSSTGMLSKLVRERAPRFGSSCQHVPPHVAVALDRALEPHLHRRYRDMRSFARALATACEQDGVVLPARPEPAGLPDFQSWRSSADVERTSPLGPVRRWATWKAMRRLPRGSKVVSRAFAGTAIAASIVATLGLTFAVQGAGKEPLVVTPRALVPATALASSSPAKLPGSSQPALTPEPPAQQVVEGTSGLVPTAVPEGRVHAKVRARGRRLAGADQAPRRAASASDRSPSANDVEHGIVTDWDWE